MLKMDTKEHFMEKKNNINSLIMLYNNVVH